MAVGLALGLAGTAVGQLLPKSSLSLDAKSVVAGSGAKTTANTYWYNSRSYESGFVIENSVHNLGREPATVELEWYFTAKLMSGGRNFVFDKGSKQLEIPPSGQVKLTIESETVSGSRSQHWYNIRNEMGLKKDGWIIRVKENGVVTRVKASSTSLETIAKNESQLEALLKRQEKP